MDRGLYVAMTGAKQIMQAQAVNNHNIANLSTIGFRADSVFFDSKPIYGPGYATRVNAVAGDAGTDFSAGTMESTGRDLDIAVTARASSRFGHRRQGSLHTGGRFAAVDRRRGHDCQWLAGVDRKRPSGHTAFHGGEHRQRWHGLGGAARFSAIRNHPGGSNQARQPADIHSTKGRGRPVAPQDRRQRQNRRFGFRDFRNAGVQQCKRRTVSDQHD